MKRIEFIRNTAAAVALYPFLNGLQACHPTPDKDKIFILVQLIGGNDGLNTLIPLDNYKKIVAARPNLHIPENKVLPLKGTSAGLHPAMKGIKDMYDHGLINFVQEVGYENPNYSHFRAADIWVTGSGSSTTYYTGCMARYLETRYRGYPAAFPGPQHPDPPAIKVGETGSYAFQGEIMDLSIVIDPASTGFEKEDMEPSAADESSYAGQEIKSIREILLQTGKYAGTIQKALGSSFNPSPLYPKAGENLLADQLKMVARLIHGGLQTSVYHVDFKGFDTHINQVDPKDTTRGYHADLLAKVSQAISCFWDDVVHMGRENDVAGMTFSEFGRRIISNASYGTDHGAAQPLMFFGAGVHPGIIGKNPDIPEKVTYSDNLGKQFDYRSVYASVMKNWFKTPIRDISHILKADYPDIKIFG